MSIKNVNEAISTLLLAYPMISLEHHILQTQTGLSFLIPVHGATDEFKDHLREHLDSMKNTFTELGFSTFITPKNMTSSDHIGGTIYTNTK